jgi:hypothetical protein
MGIKWTNGWMLLCCCYCWWSHVISSVDCATEIAKLVGSGAISATYQGRSASLSADGNTLAVGGITVNDQQGATWIYTRLNGIWSQQGSKLVGSGAVGSSVQQGYSTSLSADGNTLAVGGPADGSNQGATWIFTRLNGIWSQQGNKLIGSGSVGTSSQGRSTSLSADGNTLAIGGYADNSRLGATWIFTRSNGIWFQQGSKLVGSGSVGSSVNQGRYISLSGDGNTLAVGGDGDNSNQGATWIFTRLNGIWTQQGNKIVGSGSAGPSFQGSSPSLSVDGDTLAIGGPGDNSYQGATWIFTRLNGIWSQQGNKLVGSGSVGSSVYQGYSTYLSADGNTLSVGGYNDNSGLGATWIFTRANGIWSQQGNKLVGSGAVGLYISQGHSISLSADGNTLAIGGDGDNSSKGATWIFIRSNGIWSQQGNKLADSSAVGLRVDQGYSTSLSADGGTLVVGGPSDNNDQGATWIFTLMNGIWSQQGNKLFGSSSVGSVAQGVSTSLSSDGNTLAIGGSNDNSGQGATWLCTRLNGIWSQQGSKLVGSGAVGSSVYQGRSTTLSADGKTLAAGGPGDNSGIGSTWIFTRFNGVWSQQGNKLVGSGSVGSSVDQGRATSLSADGSTLAVSGYNDNSGLGATWVFTRSNGIWSQQGSKLVGSGGVGLFIYRGYSSALSADGNILAVGGPGDDTNQGATWIFTRSNGLWSQQGNKLVGAGAVGVSVEQGYSTSLNADGNILAVGADEDNFSKGATWIFTRLNGSWSQQGNKLVGSGAVGASGQGGSTSLSGDGSLLTIGGSLDNSRQGAVWIFNTLPTRPILNTALPMYGSTGLVPLAPILLFFIIAAF